jgi:hypothetical protein
MLKPVSFCWNPRLLACALAGAAAILLAAKVGEGFPAGSPQRIAAAAAQAAATTLVILTIVRSVRVLDEMQQRIQLEALAFAFAATAILGTAYGYLENAGLPRIKWGVWLAPVMVVLWALGLLRASRRYR